MNNKLFKQLLGLAITGEHDHLFEPVLHALHCMSRPRIYAILNACVSSMDETGLYVEVGTYQGGSLISALLNNNARAIGIDSFSEFKDTNNFELTFDNLVNFEVSERVALFNMGFQQYFQETPFPNVNVYYYDGAHDYETQLAGMEAAWNYLAADAVILVDDYIYPEVFRSVNQFVANHVERVSFLFVYQPFAPYDPVWWNGCVVLRINK